MKLKTAIKKLRKGEIQIHYDNGDLKGLNKVLLGAFPDDDKARGSNEYYLKWNGGWSGYFTKKNNRPTVKLSDIDFSKKSKLEKRVENLETILKDHLRLDHNKIDTGWKDGCRTVFANLEDKPSLLNPEELVKGKWYVDEDGDYLKHQGFKEGKYWETSSTCIKGEGLKKKLDIWVMNKPTREATQQELDSFLPDGHTDRSDSVVSDEELEKGEIPIEYRTRREKIKDYLSSVKEQAKDYPDNPFTQPNDFNTNTKYRKKGDVCLGWFKEQPLRRFAALWNETGFTSNTNFSSNDSFDFHQFMGSNIFD